MAREPKSAAQQAAQFSLFAPVAVFFIGVARIANHAGPAVTTILGWLNAALLIAGLGLGVAALFSMRRYGRRRILVPAGIGVAVCGVCVLGVGLSALGLNHARAQRLLVGRWQHPPSAGAGGTAAQQVDLTLDADNTFHLSVTGGPAGGTLSLAGAWSVTRDLTLALAVDRVDAGNNANLGQHVGMGRVKSVDADELVLSIDGRDEVFHRP